MGAGYETSSTVISLTLFELAKQPHIQDKLREEILNRMEEDNGELTYEGIFNMKYLGMVVSGNQIYLNCGSNSLIDLTTETAVKIFQLYIYIYAIYDIYVCMYVWFSFAESLRKYPPLPFLDRICVEDYKIPDSEVVIEKGTQIFIPLYNGLHYDEKYFSNPTKFDPERFTEESIKTRHPFSLLPFGEGPRSCLGDHIIACRLFL